MLYLLACEPAEDSVEATVTGPTLEHSPPASAVDGVDLALTVEASDPDGVSGVSLYYRTQNGRSYDDVALENVEGETWSVTLPGVEIETPALEYYFRAVDLGAVAGSSFLPDAYSTDPFLVPVEVTGLDFPFTEDFEQGDLDATGWANASVGFSGYGWTDSTATAHGGSTSAYHTRGIDDIDALDDYLISPPIDLSGVSEAQAVWYEYGSSADEGTHGLYISVGSRDPADGEYVEVATLPNPPEGEWGRSAIYDLSAWCGNSTVYVAWRYQGQNADDWYIDDVRVEAPTADLSASWVVSPSPIHPGESGTLSVTVSNGTDVAAEDVVVSLSFPEGGASVTESSVALGEIAGMSSATGDFSLSVDAATADNSYVPVSVTVSSGEDSLVTEGQLVVGYASTAEVGWAASAAGTLELVLGVGDPDAPSWSETVYAGSTVAGENLFSFDITEQSAWLPPAAGPLRWFLLVDADAAGEVTDFSISYAGVDYVAEVLPEVGASEEGRVWLPEPPSFVVDRVASSPGTLEPGTTGVSLDLTVSNAGATSSGPVSVTLSSSDPDVSITDAGPIELTAGEFAGGDDATLLRVFSFDVSPDHDDSTSLEFELLFTDGVDASSWALELDVPWPVFVLSDIEVSDDNYDGTLDPDEGAELELSITNVGDLSTDGAVYGSLSGTTSGSGVLTVDGESQYIGVIDVGDTKSESGFELDLVGGAAGDTVDLVLTLSDDSRSYTASTQITLGEPTWQSMSTTDDPTGDAIDGVTDMRRGFYRVYDGMLQLRVEYVEESFDPSGLFLEFWGQSSAADWDYYNVVYQSGYAYMRGYSSDFGFSDLEDPTGSTYGASTVQIDIPLDAMGLAQDSISVGWGSGWCGEPDYYCDHMPDGWGYPYDDTYGWDPGLWYDLDW